MKEIIFSFFLLSLSATPGLAHEGHESYGAIKSSHGGTVLPGKQINLEYITSGGEIKIYPLSHQGDTLDLAKVKMSAVSKLPKGKEESLKLETKENAFFGTVDLKKSHRAEVIVTAEVQGKKDIFKFQVEK